MRIQIVNFHLKGMDPEGYAALCEQLAPAFITMPGLISKTWLANPETNTFGGIYTWQDRAAMEAYLQSDLLRGVMAHPNLDEITSVDFAIMEAPSRLTRGLVGATV